MGRLVAAMLTTLLASGCASRSGDAAIPSVAVPESAAEVRAGDRIVLKIFQEEEMSDTFRIAESGEAVLPKLGRVQASGRNIAELRDSLRTSYARYLRNPSVEITVLRRVSVLGEVREPGIYLVDLTMTLRDVIAQAGGITDVGDPGKISIIRGGTQLEYGRDGSGRYLTTDLRSGDEVLVGQRNWLERNSLAFASTAAVVVSLVVPILRELF